MKFTLSWLKDHLDTDASLDEIVETLTSHRPRGRARSRTRPGAGRLHHRQGRLTAEQHPNADRLRVLHGRYRHGEPVQVVCGAPNARAGMKSALLAARHLHSRQGHHARHRHRSAASRAAACCARSAELELSDEHDGIIDLPDDAPVGTQLCRLGRSSTIPVIEINLDAEPARLRPASHGIARDLAAAGLGKLKDARRSPPVAGNGPCPVKVTLEFGDAPHALPGFALRLVRGVQERPVAGMAAAAA